MNPSTNLLKNPGFEETVHINTVQNGSFRPLLARMVDVEQGDAVPLPLSWTPNPSDGWGMGWAGVFRYVEGTPGKEVHSGTRALFLACKNHAAVMEGRHQVYPAKIPGEAGLVLNQPHRFSLAAKGAGRLLVYVYAYERSGKQSFGYKVTPSPILLTETWTKYEGTITITAPEVSSCIFVLAIDHGHMTVDDVALSGE